MAKLSPAEYDALTPEEQVCRGDLLQVQQADALELHKAKHDAAEKSKEEEDQAALPYKWRQTLGDVDLTVPITPGTRAKQLSVDIKRKRISVGLKGQPPIFSGELCNDVKEEDSTWTLGKF